MDYLKGYATSLGDFLSDVSDNISSTITSELNAVSGDGSTTQASHMDTETQNAHAAIDSLNKDESSNWIPMLSAPTSENALVYYMNSLASVGSASNSEETDQSQNLSKTVIMQDPTEVSVPTVSPPDNQLDNPNQPECPAGDYIRLPNWLSGISPKTDQVWQQMKQDFNEVVTVLSSDHKDIVTRTASSVRQGLSAVADAAKKIDPQQFCLLPESTPTTSSDLTEETAQRESDPPQFSDVPNLTVLGSEVSNMFDGIMSALFGPEKPVVKDRREARLQILRADPATYEIEPPLPPPESGVQSYADWRAGYFDEVNCQPRPGIPLCGRQPHGEGEITVEQLIEPKNPSPSELLEQYPFMGTYLSQLVRVGDEVGERISDADFWSRYYYHVWCLDVTEHRRKRLADRMKTSSAPPDLDVAVHSPSTDWFGGSDVESVNPAAHPSLVSGYPNTQECKTAELPPELQHTDDAKPSTKRPNKRRQKKSNKQNSNLVEYPNTTELSQDVVSKSPSAQFNSASAQSDEDVSLSHTSEGTHTSTSSSVVVLSNAEDDNDKTELPNLAVKEVNDQTDVNKKKYEKALTNEPPEPFQTLIPTVAVKNTSPTNSDADWDELSSDLEVISADQTTPSLEPQGWDNWS